MVDQKNNGRNSDMGGETVAVLTITHSTAIDFFIKYIKQAEENRVDAS